MVEFFFFLLRSTKSVGERERESVGEGESKIDKVSWRERDRE